MNETELVPEDDAVIGRAFRWSLAVLVVLGVAGGVVAVIVTRPDPVVPPDPATTATVVVPADAAVAPSVVFTDGTETAGIDFVHVNGATGDKLLPETMGGGCAFVDYDNDGDQDLLFVNSGAWAPASRRARLLLPAALGPTMPTCSPGSTRKAMSSSTARSDPGASNVADSTATSPRGAGSARRCRSAGISPSSVANRR